MLSDADAPPPLGPPSADVDISLGDWFRPCNTELLEQYIADRIWDQQASPEGWEVARLSSAAFIYREIKTRWSLVAKFYVEKTGVRAERHARRELSFNRLARDLGLVDAGLRAVEPLQVWRGVLLLEHVQGLTLEDIIAIRRSHPGTLIPALELAVRLLVRLHRLSEDPEQPPDPELAISDATKYVQNLAKHGVLKRRTVLRRTLLEAIDRWAAHEEMSSFIPCLTHGDATTTNFVLPPDEGVVAIDWERAKVGDPAADLGRLMAECSHCILEHGGDSGQAERAVSILGRRYREYRELGEVSHAFLKRARFHRALSTLRIARNGWLAREYRLALVAQAAQLLNSLAPDGV